MDENVHGALTEALIIRGVDVLRVQDDGLSGADDGTILERAHQLERVVITQDADFLTLAAGRQRLGAIFSGVIYARHLDGRLGRYVADLELLAKASDMDEMVNHLEYLPLK